MAADTTLRVEADTSQAQTQLKRLQDSFAGLKTAIAGIGLGAFVTSALQTADAMNDLSDATGISIENIANFTRAVQLNGGSADGAQKAIARLVGVIDEAAVKSGEARSAFDEVGVTVNDLRRLSEQDIFKKTIEGLGRIDDASKRVRVQTTLLGKEGRTLGGGLADTFNEGSSSARAFADSARQVAAANDKLTLAISTLQQQIVIILGPIAELITSFNPEQIRKFIQALLALAGALASLFIIGRIIRFLILLKDGIIATVAGAKTLTDVFVNLIRAFGIVWQSTAQASSLFARLKIIILAVAGAIAELAGPVIGALKPLVVPVLGAIAAYWGYIQDSTQAAINKIKEYASILTFGLISPPSTAGAGRGQGDIELEDFRRRQKEEQEQIRRGQEALDKVRQTNAKNTLETRQQVQALGDALSLQGFRVFRETQMLGLTEDQREVQQAMNNLYDEEQAKLAANNREIAKLRLERSFLKKDQTDEIAIIDHKIGLLNNENSAVSELYKRHSQGIRDQIEQNQLARRVEEGRRIVREQIAQSVQDEVNSQRELNQILLGINQQIAEQQTARGQVGMGPMARQIEDIKNNAQRAAREAGNAFAATFSDRGFLTPEEADALRAGLDAIAQGYRRLTEEQIANVEASRTWSAGWADAYANFVENSRNAADQARTYFETFTRGIEDAFIQFAKTGKLSFKDLVNTMIAEVVRFSVRAAMASQYANMGGLGGFLGKIFGFSMKGGGFGTGYGYGNLDIGGFLAGGGPVMAGTPYVVGERGPELFVPRSSGSIVPNNQLGGGTTMVTYNIQAVDAASFRQLVARDPAFIYAVTEKGRASTPTRRIA